MPMARMIHSLWNKHYGEAYAAARALYVRLVCEGEERILDLGYGAWMLAALHDKDFDIIATRHANSKVMGTDNSPFPTKL